MERHPPEHTTTLKVWHILHQGQGGYPPCRVLRSLYIFSDPLVRRLPGVTHNEDILQLQTGVAVLFLSTSALSDEILHPVV